MNMFHCLRVGVAGIIFGSAMRYHKVPFREIALLAIIIGVLLLDGCAALPMPLQPNDPSYNSNMAEGTFIVLAAIDTVQTMHISKGGSCDHEADPAAAFLYGSKYPKPGRVLLTNLVMITAHTMVTSWLDDEVAKHAHDDSEGLWFSGRFVWHAISIGAEAGSVVNNYRIGCRL